MKIEKLQPGMTVYSVERRQMGNVKGMSSVAIYSVKILEVNLEQHWVMVSWNGNRPTRYYERQYSKLREKSPELVRSPMGRCRLMTREEKKAAKATLKDVKENRTEILAMADSPK
jgi:hypothetical protein